MKKRPNVVAVVLLCWMAWLPEVSTGADPYALIVGHADYSGTINDRAYNITSAQYMQTILVDVYGVPSRNVRLLTDTCTTPSEMASEIEALLSHDDASMFVFFYAGHGTHIADSSYLSMPGGNFKDTTLRGLLSRTGKQRVVIVAACEAGGFVSNCAGDGTVVMSASRIDLSSWGDEFPRMLCDGFAWHGDNYLSWTSYFMNWSLLGWAIPDTSDDNLDGVVTLREGFDYAEDGVETVWNSVMGWNSDPQIGGSNQDVAFPAKLASFAVSRTAGGAPTISWHTASETKVAGWNILRRPGDALTAWRTVNPRRITGGGTTAFGEAYEFVDADAGPLGEYVYMLEAVSEEGELEYSPQIPVGGSIGGNHVDLLESDSVLASAPEPGASTLPPTSSEDYLIIAPERLMASVQPLAEFRRSQGYVVNMAAVEAVCAASIKPPEDAIRDFLAQRYLAGGANRLRYVLLVGDAVVRPGGRQVYRDGLLPTFVRGASQFGMIATDYPYACVAGEDWIPELAVGRVPSRSEKEIRGFCDKVIRHEQGISGREVAFINGPLVAGEEFAETSAELVIQNYCQGLDVQRIYAVPVSEALKGYAGNDADLQLLMNKGCAWMEFRGHGSGSMWAGFTSAEGARTGTTMGQIPLVISVSCYEGAFADYRGRISLGEAFIRNPDGGAVAYVGNTGRGLLHAGHRFTCAVWAQVRGGTATFGDAVMRAKKEMAEMAVEPLWGNAADEAFLYSLNLLGDPASSIKISL